MLVTVKSQICRLLRLWQGYYCSNFLANSVARLQRVTVQSEIHCQLRRWQIFCLLQQCTEIKAWFTFLDLLGFTVSYRRAALKAKARPKTLWKRNNICYAKWQVASGTNWHSEVVGSRSPCPQT